MPRPLLCHLGHPCPPVRAQFAHSSFLAAIDFLARLPGRPTDRQSDGPVQRRETARSFERCARIVRVASPISRALVAAHHPTQPCLADPCADRVSSLRHAHPRRRPRACDRVPRRRADTPCPQRRVGRRNAADCAQWNVGRWATRACAQWSLGRRPTAARPGWRGPATTSAGRHVGRRSTAPRTERQLARRRRGIPGAHTNDLPVSYAVHDKRLKQSAVAGTPLTLPRDPARGGRASPRRL